MSTEQLIAEMKNNAKVNNNNSVKSLYDYNKIAKNADQLFKNSSLPALIKKSANIEKDKDLLKKLRTNLRKIKDNLINECFKNADNKEKFLQSVNDLKEYHSKVFSSDIFAVDTLSNSEETKENLSKIFTLLEFYSSEKKVSEKKVSEKDTKK